MTADGDFHAGSRVIVNLVGLSAAGSVLNGEAHTSTAENLFGPVGFRPRYQARCVSAGVGRSYQELSGGMRNGSGGFTPSDDARKPCTGPDGGR